LINLARAHFYNGNHLASAKYLDRLEDIYPRNEWLNDIRGEMLMKGGQYEEAMALFMENLNINHKFFHSYVNLAKAYLAMNQEEKAIEQLISCLQINPFYEPAYKVYGTLLIEKGEIELGEKMLDFRIEGNSKYGSQ
jgi:tetratricopeptide (TPR) repeat protein